MSFHLPDAGMRLAEKYDLDDVIGRGGFAIVFRGVDTSLGRSVAVKVLKPGEHGYEPKLASRFVREAKLVANLQDEHTIRMFDFGRTDDGVLFMVFELLGGEDLSDRLEREGAMDQGAVEHVVRQVLSSLREAHSQGLLHRDIKPGNIRVFEYMGDPLRVKLMDFGIARTQGPNAVSLTATGSVIGTPRYMSPEQLAASELGPPSDLFSLGLVTYEMLTGNRTGPRQDIVLGDRVEMPATGRLGAALEAMLRADPEARAQSAQEVLDILDGRKLGDTFADQALQSETLDWVPTSEAPRPRDDHADRVQPSPRSAIATVVISMLVGAVIAIGATMLASDRPSRDVAVSSRVETARLGNLLNTAEKSTPPQTESPTPALAVDVGEATDLAPSDEDGCGNPVRDGASLDRTLRFGLEERDYMVILPTPYDETYRHPIVLAFHTDGLGAGSLLKNARLYDTATELNAIVVIPSGNGPLPWREDDIHLYMERLFEEVSAEVCVDESRVLLFGNGSGGQAADRLSCQKSVVGYVSMGHRMLAESEFGCRPTRPVPYLHLAPMDTGHLPIEGGRGCFMVEEIVSLERHERLWSVRNGCSDEPRIEKINDSDCRAFSCDDAPFVSCRLDGGLPFPGQDDRAVDVLSCDGNAADFPYFDRIWSFFKGALASDPSRPSPPL